MFNSVIEKCISLRKIRGRKKKIPWFSKEIEDYKMFRDHLHEKAASSNLEEDWKLYKVARNRVTCIFRNAKKKYLCEGVNKAKGKSSVVW